MSRIARGFPQQSRIGAPTWHAALGPRPAVLVLPLPTLAMQTITIKGVAVRVRVAYPRRTVRHFLFPPIPPKQGVDNPSGSASPSGSIVEAATYADTQQGAAAPTGSAAETTSTGIRLPVVTAVFAGHRRGHVYARPAQVVTTTVSHSDVVSGSAAASGSLVATLTHSSSPSGSSSATGTVAELYSSGKQSAVVLVQMATGRRNVQTFLRAPVVVQQGGISVSDVANGRSSATGSIAWAEIHVTAPAGSASPTGFVGESYGGPPGPISIRVVSLTISQSRAYRWRRRVMSLLLAPMVIAPPTLPLPDQARIRVVRAGRSRLEERRRRGHVSEPLARVIGPAVYADNPTGQASPTGTLAAERKIGSDSPAGTASATGTTLNVKAYGDAPSGAASASGSVVQQKIGNDLVSGSSSATGTCSDSFQVGNVFNDHVLGSAAPAGTRAEANSHTSSPAGTQTARGSVVEVKIFPDAPHGQAAATGNLFFEQHVWNDTTTVGTSAPSGAALDAFTARCSPTGTATASGSVVERNFVGFGDTIVHVTVLALRGRWAVNLRG